MKKLRNQSIRRQIFLFILLTAGCALFLGSIGTMLFQRTHAYRNIRNDLSSTAEVLGSNSSAALSFQDADAASEMLSALSAKPWMTAASLHTTDGVPLAHYVKQGHDWQVEVCSKWSSEIYQQAMTAEGYIQDRYLFLMRDVTFQERKIGTILLVNDLRQLDEHLASTIGATLLSACIGFLIAIALASRFQRVISSPILALQAAVQRVAQGDLDVRADIHTGDEVQNLAESFNSMTGEIYRSHQALTIAREEAESASEAKSRFLANMSHEIRTPLNGVVGMLKLLRESPLNGKQTRFVSKGLLSADALLTVINDVLDFSKIEAGKLEIEQVPFDLVETTEEVVQMFAQRAEEKQLELVCRIAGDVPTAVSGDPNRIAQVLINLISNALKFTEQGDVTVRVLLAADEENEVVIRFEVQDSGIGIALENKERLFEPFLQEDSSTTRRFGGTGLGLGICRELVRLMGGQIQVDSSLGKGSTFGFTLRLGKEATDEQKPRRIRGLRTLIVDDHPECRALLRAALEIEECALEEAADGASALALMHERAASGLPFELVLVDWKMPGMSGEELARRIKADASLQQPALLLMSSINDINNSNYLNAGFDGSLTKPIRQSELCDVIVHALDGGTDAFAPAEAVRQDSLFIGNKRKILLVEDNEINQEVAREILVMSGLTCDIVGNGREALEAVAAKDYDLIFMDCMMPEMDGYEATRRLREREAGCGRHTPIVALTANAMKGDREECLEAGMDDYLSKPLDPAEVIAMVRKWV